MTPLRFRAWAKGQYGPPHMVPMIPGEDKSGGSLSDLLANDDWKVMQSTGLRDKNGTEIFEGDVVKSIRRTTRGRYAGREDVLFLEVRWIAERAAFFFHFEKMKWDAMHGSEDNYEVIGNIYENPDLLPQK